MVAKRQKRGQKDAKTSKKTSPVSQDCNMMQWPRFTTFKAKVQMDQAKEDSWQHEALCLRNQDVHQAMAT